jgi:hypothetical protein
VIATAGIGIDTPTAATVVVLVGGTNLAAGALTIGLALGHTEAVAELADHAEVLAVVVVVAGGLAADATAAHQLAGTSGRGSAESAATLHIELEQGRARAATP